MLGSFAASVFLAVVSATFVDGITTVSLDPVQGRTGAYMEGTAHAGRARAAAFKNRAASGPTTIPATNLAYVQYTASIGVGSPATYYNLVVDTGSSNTFVG